MTTQLPKYIAFKVDSNVMTRAYVGELQHDGGYQSVALCETWQQTLQMVEALNDREDLRGLESTEGGD